VIRKIPPGQYAQRPPPPPPLILVQTGPSRVMWDESYPRLLRGGVPTKAGVTPLPAQGPDPSAALTFDLGETKSMIFHQISAQGSDTAFRPGVQRPEFSILMNIHKFRDINPKKGPPPV
jgi:hypothetical protein